MTIYDVVLTITRLLVGLIFVAAALPKIGRPRRFKSVVRNYHILPDSMSSVVAYSLPGFELTTGIMLIVNFLIGPAYLISGLLFTGFAVALSVNLFRQREINCGCSGKASDKISWRKVVSNSILGILSFWLASVYLANSDGSPLNLGVSSSTWQTTSLLSILSIIASRLAEQSVSFPTWLVAIVIGVSGLGLASVTLHVLHRRRQARQHEIQEWSAFAKGTGQMDSLQR